jgi:hypothetical protein
MKKLMILAVLLSALLMSCEKEPVAPEMVKFTLNVNGYVVEMDDFNTLKSATAFDDFVHVYPNNCSVSFNNTVSGVSYSFSTGDYRLNEFTFTLPAGNYTISGSGGEAVLTGTEAMYFKINSGGNLVEINESTISVNVNLTPNSCVLILVDDPLNLMTEAILGAKNDPFYVQGECLYVYAYTTGNTPFYIYKNDGTRLLMHINDEIRSGTVCKITLTEEGGQNLVIDAGFDRSSSISF